MNTPTKLTVSRIVLTLIIIVLLLFPWSMIGVSMPVFFVSGIKIELKYIIADLLFVIASFTDFLDGYLARKNHEITNTGKMLDAIADKVLVDSVLIILACNGFISAIVPVVIVIRDIVVDAIKMEAASKGKVVAAIKSGKIKTASLMIGIVLMMAYNLPFELINVHIDILLLYFATIMSIFSMIEYYNVNKGIIFPNKEK